MKRVWVTRDENVHGRLSTALRRAGLIPVVEPVLATTTITDAAQQISTLTSVDWLVLTSCRAINAVAGPAARVPQVAVVGEPSRQEALRHAMRVALVSPSGYGAELWTELAKRAQGRRILFAHSSLAPLPQIPELNVQSVVVYQVKPRAFDHSVIHRVDVTAFASASAVDAVHTALGHIPQPAASIGNTVSARLRHYRTPPAAQASKPTFTSLAAAIAHHLP